VKNVGLFHADKRDEHSTKPFFLQIKVANVSHPTPPPKLIIMLLVEVLLRKLIFKKKLNKIRKKIN
jgi:hypothetical protein